MSVPLQTLQIGMTASGPRSGGLDRYFFNLLSALRAHDVRSRGLVAGDPAVLTDDLRRDIECFAPDSATLLQRVRGLRDAVGRRIPDADVVVSHFAPYTFAIADRLRGRPIVVHMHGSWAREAAAEGQSLLASGAKRVIERIAYRGGARIVVLSHAVARVAEREYGVPAELVRVVPGGVDLNRFRITSSRGEARASFGLPEHRPVVLTAARLVRAKGLGNVIEAVARVVASIPDVLLVIAGTGPLETMLRIRVQQRGITRNVQFVGFVGHDRLPLLFRAADLLVVPSPAIEGFGLVALEALACGTPALVTPVMGLPEVVAPLDSRLVLDETSADAIARGIERVLGGAIELPSEQCCVAYARRFAWETIAEAVSRIYREVA